jgi:hypothetical protein
MGELQAFKRAPSGVRRRNVQGRLSIHFGEEENGGESFSPEASSWSEGARRSLRSSGSAQRENRPRKAPPIFHPLAYRSVVAGWSLESREEWGRRANQLEETGLAWRDAETQAFVEVWQHLRHATPAVAAEPAESDRLDDEDEHWLP